MATKPSSTPEIWASNALYTTGPFIGLSSKVVPAPAIAAEGHRPGAAFPTPAEYENSQQNLITTWIKNWLSLGSSAGAADAHVVETNAAGRTAVTGLTVNDPVDETAVSITSVATAANMGLLVSCTTGGTAVATSIGNAGAINYLAGTGSGAGAEGVRVAMTGTPNTGTGYRVNADAATAAPGVRIEHQGSGHGLLLTHIGSGQGAIINAASGSGFGLTVNGNSSNVAASITGGAGQAALQAIAGNNAAAAIGAQAAGTSYGIDALGGAGSGSADAIRGTAVNVGAVGVHGRSSSGAGNGAGVQGDGIGAGQIGVFGTATAGYAFLFQGDSTPPLYPIGRFVPQSADPTASTSTGDFTISVQDQFRYCVAGFGYKPFMSMPTNGSAVIGVANLANGAVPIVVNASGASWNNVLTVSCLASQGNGFYSQLAGNTVKVRFTAEVRTTSLAANVLNLQLVDTTGVPFTFASWTGSGSAPTAGFLLGVADTGWQRTILAEGNRAPGSDGNLTIQVQAQKTGGGASNMEIRNARLEVLGAF